VLRRICALISGLSLLVFVTTIVLWFISYQENWILWSNRQGETESVLRIKSGSFRFERKGPLKPGFRTAEVLYFPGIQSAGKTGDTTQTRYFVVEFASICVISVGGGLYLIAIAISRIWSFRRRDEKHCVSCRYDLTGNVSGVCPECGSTVRTD